MRDLFNYEWEYKKTGEKILYPESPGQLPEKYTFEEFRAMEEKWIQHYLDLKVYAGKGREFITFMTEQLNALDEHIAQMPGNIFPTNTLIKYQQEKKK